MVELCSSLVLVVDGDMVELCSSLELVLDGDTVEVPVGLEVLLVGVELLPVGVAVGLTV